MQHLVDRFTRTCQELSLKTRVPSIHNSSSLDCWWPLFGPFDQRVSWASILHICQTWRLSGKTRDWLQARRLLSVRQASLVSYFIIAVRWVTSRWFPPLLFEVHLRYQMNRPQHLIPRPCYDIQCTHSAPTASYNTCLRTTSFSFQGHPRQRYEVACSGCPG